MNLNAYPVLSNKKLYICTVFKGQDGGYYNVARYNNEFRLIKGSLSPDLQFNIRGYDEKTDGFYFTATYSTVIIHISYDNMVKHLNYMQCQIRVLREGIDDILAASSIKLKLP